MDFGAMIETVSGFLEERGLRYAVIGGMALAAYGLPRTTVDLDFVVDSTAWEPLASFLDSLGFGTLHRSEGYSNHLHPDSVKGRIDFVYVRGRTAQQLFESVRHLPGPRGKQIPVPKPEHLAAMKVLALKNDPSRTFQEMADIRFLLALPGVNRAEIQSYFERHGLEDRFHELGQA